MKNIRTNFRNLTEISALLCLLSLGGVGLGAEASLSIGSTPGFPGIDVSVPAIVSKATNIVAAQFDVSFNTAKVTANQAARGGAAPNHIVRSREIAPGIHRILTYSLTRGANTISNRGAIATMAFSISPSERVSSGPIAPFNAILALQDGTPAPPPALAAGEIFMRPVHRDMEGKVKFFLPSMPDERYTVQATTDFERWINLTNVVALGNFLDLVDLNAPGYSRRYYRWVLTDALGTIAAVDRRPNGTLELRIEGLPDRTYTIQASTNLESWIDIGSNVAVGGLIQFVDPDAVGYRQRFYRLVSDP